MTPSVLAPRIVPDARPMRSGNTAEDDIPSRSTNDGCDVALFAPPASAVGVAAQSVMNRGLALCAPRITSELTPLLRAWSGVSKYDATWPATTGSSTSPDRGFRG